MIFLDTSIVIDYLKGECEAIESIGLENVCVSDIVLMELYQGARSKSDLAFIKKELQPIGIVETGADVVMLARQIVERYTLSHGAKIMDALIAATVLVYDLPLYTLNVKDFRYIDKV